MLRVTLYSKPDCHLCDQMKVVVERVRQRIPFHLDVIDVSTDLQLERLYGLEIPVLMVDGKKAAKYRISEDELERRLSSRGARLHRPR